VTWADAATYGPWRAIEDGLKAKHDTITTRGTVVVNNSNRVSVALSMSELGESVSDVLVIPRACVKRIRRLK
jgi:hypothetical protein